MRRRTFLRSGMLLGAGLSLAGRARAGADTARAAGPVVVSTWGSIAANTAAWASLESSGSVLDAVEQGARVEEANPDNASVGFGGLPNRDGVVELDAAIMDGARLEAGAVGGLR